MSRRPQVHLVPLGDALRLRNLYANNVLHWTLGDLLKEAPAMFYRLQIPEDLLKRKLDDLEIRIIQPDALNRTEPLFLPPGMSLPLSLDNETATPFGAAESAAVDQPELGAAARTDNAPDTVDESATGELATTDGDFPREIALDEAVRLAYSREIGQAASFLRAGLPVLVFCEKLVVEYLSKQIARQSAHDPVLLEVTEGSDGGVFKQSHRQRELEKLKELIKNLKLGQVLVIRHLDLLAGGSDSNLSSESREIIELIYEAGDRLILAFADKTLDLPEVLAARFAVRLSISGLWPTVITPQGERKIGQALITAKEARHFSDYDPDMLYKNIAGMNPVRLRQSIGYAISECPVPPPAPVETLYSAIRKFKAQTSANFEVPNVTWDNIGGHDDVKKELQQATNLILGSHAFDKRLQAELIPKGFIFYGPPGTGKTLFAKAVANQMNATIQVVSGPEVTDMYVGESERKVRELFAEARRNAPAVLVFDEFDSIATKRSGRDDGGSRAGNALVAQILTEMDGFRPEVPLLVIGTTNRIDIIDEALLRPSRFKSIHIGLPDPEARAEIARVHARHFGIPVSAEIVNILAGATASMNGDDIRSIFREACVEMRLRGREIDAKFLGRLVGQLRRAAQERVASKGAQQNVPSRSEPAGSMTRLNRPEPGPAADSGRRPDVPAIAASQVSSAESAP